MMVEFLWLEDIKIVPLESTDNWDSAEIFDPVTEQFAPVANNMIVDRYNGVALTLSDGRVAIFGGRRCIHSAIFGWTTQNIKNIEIFDPITGQFSNGGTMQGARSGFSTFLLSDGRVLLFGNKTANHHTSDTLEIYDPVTKTSSSIGNTGIFKKGKLTRLQGDEFLLVVENKARKFNPVDGFGEVFYLNKNRIKSSVLGLSDGSAVVVGGGDDPESSEIEYYQPLD